MTMEQLHFMVESPANFVRLACTILFEKREAMAEWAATWHDVFDCANGEQLFLQFMEELFPDGCTIGEKELNRITDRAVRYLQTETRCLDLKAGHDKSRFTYWVSFIPEHKVYGCEFARHEETIIEKPKVEAYCKSIVDARMYLVFRLRFIRCYSWAEVAGVLGKGYTEDGVSRMAYNYLNKN